MATLAPIPSQNPKEGLHGSIGEVWKNGRPYRYQSIQEAQEDVESYFLECEATGERPNMAGLSLAMGVSHTALNEWAAYKPSHSPEGEDERITFFRKGLAATVSRAKAVIARAWHRNLEDRDKARGAEFILKTLGYQDKPDVYLSPNITVNQQQNNIIATDSQALKDLLAGMLPTPTVR
jgi:hypothetical protein